jgi:hypothetical protein
MSTLRNLESMAAVCLAALVATSAAFAQGQQEHPPQGQPHAQAPAPAHAPSPVPHYGQPTLHANTSPYYPPHYNPPHGTYPPRGTTVGLPPSAPVVINHPSGHYYYSGGVWYAPRGPSYVVVAAPIGVFVPVLPVYYTTVWANGAPYYYANDTYYAWSPAQNSYETVSPPSDDGIPAPEDPGAAAPAASAPAPLPDASDGLFVYPQHGQSDEQQATDRYECHKWATMQSGFDPTLGATSAAQPGSPDDYDRAIKACLEGRGYSVR